MTKLNPTEISAKQYFEHNGILLSKVPETTSKTPDFEGEAILVEVKSVMPKEIEGLSIASTYNALKNNLQDSARKFRSYDSEHFKSHIVIVYSEEITKDDIYSVWTGEWSPEHKDKIFASGMLLSKIHKKQIDAIAWFKKGADSYPRYVWATNEDLRRYFPETILSK